MNHCTIVEEHIKTTDGKDTLFVKSFKSDKEIGAITFVHGLGEHCSRYGYTEFFTKLAQEGFTVNAFDHRGHGQSTGKRGHIENFGVACADITQIFRLSPEHLPRFICGHSMGGCMTLYYALKHIHFGGVKGVIVTGPAIEPGKPIHEFTRKLGTAAKSILPSLTISSNLDVQGVTRDPQRLQDYKDDHLNHGLISLALADSILSTGPLLVEEAPNFLHPLLLFHGEADTLTSPKASEKFFKRVGSQDKTIKIWPNLYHELHNEPERDQVISEIIQWLLQRVQPSTTTPTTTTSTSTTEDV